MSIFDQGVDRDYYLQHMKETMDWEARWLKQLIAECVAKHQMLEAMQRRMTETACAGLAMMPQQILYSDPKKDGK